MLGQETQLQGVRVNIRVLRVIHYAKIFAKLARVHGSHD